MSSIGTDHRLDELIKIGKAQVRILRTMLRRVNEIDISPEMPPSIRCVVLCKDCKHVETNKCPMYKAHFGYTDNDYCSCGELKEQEHENNNSL